jgi:DNA-binding CsgD family transcriptional regulator
VNVVKVNVTACTYPAGMLVGRTGLSPVMVGRAAELDRLAQLLGARRTPSVALVAAEAGLGKTRLIQELVARVPAGTVVLAGQADPGALGRPMELFLDSLDGIRLEAYSELVDVVGDRSRTGEERVAAGVELVGRLTSGKSGLVVFEDLHWADSESLELLEELAEPDAGRLLLIGSYRPDGLSRRHPAADLLPRLERRHSVTRLHLAPLGPSDVGALLTAVYGQVPSFRVVEALHARTGGNPFFLEELVAAAGDAAVEELDCLPLPWTVAEAVRGQYAELAEDERRIVSAAAVLGRRVPFDLLAAVTGTSEERLIPLLHRLVSTGLVLETDPDVFGFRHELAREAIEGALLGRERRRLHEAGLAALERAGSRDFAALARHARGSARFEDLVATARKGAREYRAVGSTHQALELAELGLSEAEDDLELRALAAESAWYAGLAGDAARHADRWLELARLAGDVAEEARALSLRTRLALDYGDNDLAASLTDTLVGTLDRLPGDGQRAQAMAAIAQSYMLRDLPDQTRQWADKAISLAEASHLPAIRLSALVEKGSILMSRPGSEAEGRALLEEAAEGAGRLGERVIAARALNNLVWHARQWAPDEVRDRLERMRQHAEAVGFACLGRIGYAEGQATLNLVDGDLDGAIAALARARRAERGQVPTQADWFSILQAGLALEAGELDAAEQFTREAKPARPKTTVAIIGLDLNLALRRNDLGKARQRLAELTEAVRIRGWITPDNVHDLLAPALRAGFTVADFGPLLDRVALWAGRPLEPDNAWHSFLAAQVAESAGRWPEAAESYLTAAAGLRAVDVEMAGHRGTAHVGAARALIALNRLEEARAHAGQAAEILARWRGWRVEDLEAVRRRLGLGAELSGPDALTPREREVVGLLAAGLTNSQLADRLYISPRTAAVHVSNILAKLGMSSRTEVAAWAVRAGLDPAS